MNNNKLNQIHRSTLKEKSYKIKDQIASELARVFYNKQNEDSLISHDELFYRYTRPLSELLVEYLYSSKFEYKAIYQEELLKYAPRRESLNVRVDYFSSIIPLIEDITKSYIEGIKVNDVEKSLTELHEDLLFVKNNTPINLITVGDCLMGEVRVFLNALMRELSIPFDMRSLYFSSCQGVDLDIDSLISLIENSKADIISLSFLTFDGLPIYRYLQENCHKLSENELDSKIKSLFGIVSNYIFKIREITNATILMHNVCGLPLRKYRKRLPFIAPLSLHHRNLVSKLNDNFNNLKNTIDNCLIINEKEITDKYNIRNCNREVFTNPIFKRASFHTSYFGYYLSRSYYSIILSYYNLKKIKLILLDFDNTLWKGVMAESEVAQYTEKQLLLKKLQENGILLAVTSKNTFNNIRWNEMILKQEDFVSLKINWNPKTQSIAEIANELNLGMDSFLFIDDNPIERELVTKEFPIVKVLNPDKDDTWLQLGYMLDFPNTANTDVSQNRTNIYKSQAKRKKLTTSYNGDMDLIMSNLELEIKFGLAKGNDVDRVCELVQRTNQFNTTAIRYRKENLLKIIESDKESIYVAELSDKFGKLGIVLVAITMRESGGKLIFNNYVMSCRAMGFGLESKVLELIMEKEKDSHVFIGKYIPTDRNEPVAKLFQSLNFKESNDGWVLDSKDKLADTPGWFRVIHR